MEGGRERRGSEGGGGKKKGGKEGWRRLSGWGEWRNEWKVE